MKNNVIYTCYGCEFYHKDHNSRYNYKHCGQDHAKCPYYLGTGKPLGIKKEEKKIEVVE